MRFRITAFVIAPALFLGILGAQSASIKKVPLHPTSPTSGAEMYTNYCAVCHGADGKGAGPAAAALKSAPLDLSQLAAKNGGKFPEERVSLVLSARTNVTAHGSSEMPIWGQLLKTLGTGTDDIVRLRVVNLTYYVKSLQAR